MFMKYFQLAREPFGATPDPRFLFPSDTHREALASLYCGYYANRGFTALIAEPGMGKTTLLFDFINQIRDRASTAFIFNTLCTPEDLMFFILRDLGIEPSAHMSMWHAQLDSYLAAKARAGRRVVIVIDEAQNLSTRALEAIRLLTNFETPNSKLMQLVLAGQPQLAENLAKPEAAQLLQRISTISSLKPLTIDDVKAYILHRLKVAGFQGGQLFTDDAIALVSTASRGIPRIVNTLCFNALCLCRARKARRVDQDIVREVIADLQLPSHSVTAASPPVALSQDNETSVGTGPGFDWWRLASFKYAAALVVIICSALAGMRTQGIHANQKADLSVEKRMTKSPDRAAGGGAAQAPAVPVIRPNSDGIPIGHVVQQHEGANAALQKVTITDGDTLEAIVTDCAGKFDPLILKQIRELNPSIVDPNHIETGRTLLLPARSTPQKVTSDKRTRP